MSDTSPNAYRLEAAEKRRQAAALASEADTLDAQAEALEHPGAAVEPAEVPEAPTVDTSGEEKQSRFKK